MYYYKSENGFESRSTECLDHSLIPITEEEYNAAVSEVAEKNRIEDEAMREIIAEMEERHAKLLQADGVNAVLLSQTISLERAGEIRVILDYALKSVEDVEASKAVELFHAMVYDGGLIKGGTRINWNGQLKRATVDLWNTKENDPENAPELWEDIPYYNGYRIIPEVITATLAFAAGEVGYWQGGYYKAKYAGTVHNPSVNPDGWEVV